MSCCLCSSCPQFSTGYHHHQSVSKEVDLNHDLPRTRLNLLYNNIHATLFICYNFKACHKESFNNCNIKKNLHKVINHYGSCNFPGTHHTVLRHIQRCYQTSPVRTCIADVRDQETQRTSMIHLTKSVEYFVCLYHFASPGLQGRIVVGK